MALLAVCVFLFIATRISTYYPWLNPKAKQNAWGKYTQKKAPQLETAGHINMRPADTVTI